MVNLDDAEVFAQRELQRAALDGHDAPPWRILLARLSVQLATFGDGAPMRRAGHVGRFGVVGGAPTVYVWSGMSERDQALTAWHEYAHHIVVAERLALGCHVERWCTRFAAAMVAPADSVQRAWRACGRNLLRLAEMRPATSSSVLLLRLGDLELAPVALYDSKGPRHVRPEQRLARGITRVVEMAKREGFAENELASAWRLPDASSRVGVLLAA